MHAVEHTHTHTHTPVPLPIKSGSALRVSQDFFTERLAVFDFVISTSNKTTGTAEGFTKVKTNRKNPVPLLLDLVQLHMSQTN